MKKFLPIIVVAWLFVSGCAGTNNYSATSTDFSGGQDSYQGQQETVPVVDNTDYASAPPSTNDFYTNVDGNKIQSPTYYDSQPTGASAICGDGTYSFSQHRQGTCSHHGGVDEWL